MKPDSVGLTAAIEAVQSGEPVLVPTDTVYGLAVRVDDASALDKVFALKRQPVNRSVAVLVGDVGQASEFAVLNKYERRVVERCWPGPLTLVLNRVEMVEASIADKDGTVGVRCPDNAFVRMLALAVGPLATTSANISGERTRPSALDAVASLDGDVAVTIDGGPCEGQTSTVARVDHDGDILILRSGGYSQRDLERIARQS